jgi:membrane peptidoglycan carboxypeptidase
MTSREIAMRRRARRRGTVARNGTTNRRRWLMVFAVAFLGMAFIGALAVGGAAMYAQQRYNEIAETVVPAEDLIEAFSRGGARVHDRNGELMYEFVDEFGGLRRPVALSQISDRMIEATISTEDNDFWENRGVNLRGLIRAGLENLTPFRGDSEFFEGSGGSSITQQLAKNIYIPREQRAERSIERKIQETVIALELTERYSKEQILEWYLNSISYGGIYVGIEAAAEGYFDKGASELTLAEAALLAGIPQSPSLYYPLSPANFDVESGQLAPASLAKARQSEILDLMVRNGVITMEEADAARAERLNFRQRRFDITAPHFVLGWVRDEITARWGERALFEEGLEIITTLDMNLQRMAEEIVERNVAQFGEQANLHNGAFIALDPHTGQILTYVGSRDYFRRDIEGQNDNIQARNSPGSTLKPFTYITALTKGWGTGTTILDTPVTFTDGAGSQFTPRNPGTGFRGPVTVAEALGNSYNIPANKTMAENTVPDTIAMYKRFGFSTLDNPGGYGVALTTGGGEITLLDQAIAYSVLATGGIMRGQEAVVTQRHLDPGERELEPIGLLRVSNEAGVWYEFDEPEERRIIAEEYTYLISNILSDPQNTCITYGACGALSLPNGYPAAAKTGTSEPFETQGLIGETWTMGYTPHLVSGIWAGNADNDPIRGISSTTVSLRAWKEFMVEAIEYLGHPATPFERPAGVVSREVCWPSGKLPTDQCPSLNRYQSLYAAEVIPDNPNDAPDMFDSWWRRTAIDMRTGMVAGSNTPSQFVREEVRLVLPEEEIRGWGGLSEWAARTGVAGYLGSAPGDAPTGPHPAQIVSPAANAVVSGDVEIRGRATSEDFIRYFVEWGRGDNPSSWVRIDASIEPAIGNALLGTWNTRSVPDGEYTIRVRLDDRNLGTRVWAIPVTVANAGDAPDADYAPVVNIAGPQPNSTVSGVVTVEGTATSPYFLGYQLQVGAGANPTQWQTLQSSLERVEQGVLGSWDTTGIQDGQYTIRVVLTDQFFQNATQHVQVIVRNQASSDGGDD